MKKPLYKSTIVIWTEYDPSALEVIRAWRTNLKVETLIDPKWNVSVSLSPKRIRPGTVRTSSIYWTTRKMTKPRQQVLITLVQKRNSLSP